MAAPRRHLGTFFGAAAAVVVLDQLTKQWALWALADGPIDLVGSLRLNLVFNDRAAFSLGFGSTTTIALVGCSLVTVLVVMGVRAEQRGWALGLGIILGGALGKRILLEERMDPTLLGGFVAQVGSYIVDGSLDGQLGRDRSSSDRASRKHRATLRAKGRDRVLNASVPKPI